MVRNTLKLLSAVGLVLLVPTGTPDDIFMIPLLIKTFGYQLYIIITIVSAILLYNSIKGRTINEKIATVKRELKIS
jgi:hypothetical protein